MGESAGRRARAFADRITACCSRALGTQLVASILHGSLTMGDFTPGQSHIDLLLVVEPPRSDAEISTLREAVDAVASEALTRVDLRVVTRTVAASPTPTPAMEASFTIWPGRPMAVETRVAGKPDLAVEFSLVRSHGRSITGPDPRAVIGAVPAEWVVDIGDRQMAAWEQLTDDGAHDVLMVLTTCRMWRFHAERVHCSKSDAGSWALARDPSLTAVREALRKRGGEAGVTIGADGIRRLLAIVRHEVANR